MPSFRKKIQNERTFGSRFLKIFKIKQHANMGFWKIFKELWGFMTNETHAGVDIPFSKSLLCYFFPLWYLMGISWISSGYHKREKGGGGSKTLVWSLHWILHSIKPLALGYTKIEIMPGSHRPLLWWHPWPWALPHFLRTAYKGSIYPFLVKWFLKPPSFLFYLQKEPFDWPSTNNFWEHVATHPT